MADVRQGVSYEITATDSTGPATDSALANLLRQEQAAKKANEAAKKEAEGARGLFAALTNALAGNFQALGEQVAKAAAKLGGFKLGAKALGAVGFAAAGAVSAARGLAEAFRSAAAERRELEDARVADAIAGAEAKAFADEMERARGAAEDQRRAFDDELQLIREMTKAQNELVKQRELALAKTPEERDEIGRRHARNDAANGAWLDGEARRREIADAEAEVARTEAELASARTARERANKVGRGVVAELNGMQNRSRLGIFWGELTDRMGFTDNRGDEARAARNAEESARAEQEAAKRVAELERRLEAARHRLEVANRREEAALVADAAAEQAELNEDFRRHDEAAARERADEDAREADAAQARVRQAWGWYRDRDAMAAQLREERADAEAARRYDGDFRKLRDRRPDWETAKNLSVDQEAVKRVALARREEDAARRAATETAANTARAAASLEAIERAFNEGGE